MAKSTKKGSGGTTSSQGGSENEPSETPATTKATSESVTIGGVAYKVGDKVTLGSAEYTVVNEQRLPASSTSGVEPGFYPVLSVVLQPGNRTAYRALVDDKLYPIREYGSENAVISKIRSENKEPRGKRSKSASTPVFDEADGISLSAQANRLLDAYLDLEPSESRSQVLSGLVIEHLGPKVEQLQQSRDAINKLPRSLLAKLAGMDPDDLKKFEAGLK